MEFEKPKPKSELEEGEKNEWLVVNYPDEYKVKDFTEDMFKNFGIGADIGAVYDFDFGLSVSLALNNLGFINWKRNLQSFSVDKQKYEFEGVEMNEPMKDKSMFENYMDSIWGKMKDEIKYDLGSKSLKTTLVPSIYLGVSYDLTETISAGFLSRTEFFSNNISQTFNISGNMLLYNVLSLNLNLSQQINGSTYAGMGIALYAGPLEIYFLTDYLPLRYSNVRITDKWENKQGETVEEELFAFGYMPVRFKDGAFMFGINLLFGGKGFKDRPMHDNNFKY
jgi:hypothetical protein